MKVNKLITIYAISFLMVFVIGCALVSMPAATSESSATNTPAFIAASAPAVSRPMPAGFNSKGVPGLSPIFLVPDGWYFTTEMGAALVNNYFVTREKDPAGTSWHFSTGLSLGVTSHPDEANAEFARSFIDFFAKKDSTKKILSNSHSEKGNFEFNELLIEAEYADTPQDSPDHNKTVYYIDVFDKTAKILYTISFESPTTRWEEEWKSGKVMVDDFIDQLSSSSGATSQTGFTNTLANTIEIPVNLSKFDRPSGMPSAAKSKFLETSGGGLTAVVPEPNSPWQENYSLDLNTIGELPTGAVIEVDFENPLDASTAIAVRLSPTSSASIHVESPRLSGFKCQNYWVTIQIYADIRQSTTLDSYVQWINSAADLSKVTSSTDLVDGKTCQ